MTDTLESTTRQPLARLTELLESGTYRQIRNLIDSLKPEDLADLLESSPPRERAVIWSLATDAQQSDILQSVDEDIVNDLLSDKTEQEIVHLLEDVDSDDDLTDILQQLPEAIAAQVLESMDAQDRARLENLLSWPEDTAGGLMNTDTVSVRARVTLDVVLRYLRRHVELPPITDSIFVVSSTDEFIGLLPISKLLVSDPSMTVREMMTTDIQPIPAPMHETEVAKLFERYDLISAPVVDENGKLLGRITIDDVVDVIMDKADHSLLGMAGLTEDDDPFAPVFKTVRMRTFWLGANLLTAFLASAVINIFEETIAKVVALAVLMPIVASMGGVAGSQALTVVIRSMAQGHLVGSNQRWLLSREFAVGIVNGLFWALIVAAGASLAFQDPLLGLIIAMALIINLVTAGIAGAALPGILKKLHIDPAIAGTVVLTTITDVVGFMSFLGLATLFYA